MTQWTKDQAERGRRLALDAALSTWELGDLAAEVAPKDSERIGAVLGEFGEEIGVSGKALMSYRVVSLAWPQEKRNLAAPWSMHRDLLGREDRFAVLDEFVAYAQVHRQKVNRPNLWKFTGKEPWQSETRARVEEAPPPPSVEAMREALADPRVAAEVLADSKTRATVTHQTERIVSVQRERTESRRAADPVAKALDSSNAVKEMTSLMLSFGHRMGELLREASEFPETERGWFLRGVERAEQAVQGARQFVETGATPMDAALAELLKDGA